MEGTKRSESDRTTSVTELTNVRAHIGILTRRQDLGADERRANDCQPDPVESPVYVTGRPSPQDFACLFGAARLPLDLSRPMHSRSTSVWRALGEMVPGLRSRVRTRVARLDGDMRAGVAFRIVEPDNRWNLELMVMHNDDAGFALDAALRCAVRDAGACGARRIAARLPGGLVVDSALRRAGFVPYTDEEVFLLRPGRASEQAERPSRVRRVHPADVWGIHQLYLDVEPRQVQYADARTSSVWEDAAPLRLRSRRSSGWIVEEDGRIRGYVQLSTREDVNVIRVELLIDSARRSLATELLAAALREANRFPEMPCIVSVPAYRRELRSVVIESGFESLGVQTAWVCYTTVPARSQVVAVDLRSRVSGDARRVTSPGFGSAGMRDTPRVPSTFWTPSSSDTHG